ncbi:uncharacterized protein M6B38_177340 [Iris pallida]|uniref:Uncharacterized protein n=1 Tax=Iris pallida TaxID=29817 RepID=A0AAX6EP34_IRIPA|nr:uncharacterized protein M6B38_177340 [Iris pallida]
MAGFGRRIRLGNGEEKGSGVRREFVLARFDRSGEERRSRKVGAGLLSAEGAERERNSSGTGQAEGFVVGGRTLVHMRREFSTGRRGGTLDLLPVLPSASREALTTASGEGIFLPLFFF